MNYKKYFLIIFLFSFFSFFFFLQNESISSQGIEKTKIFISSIKNTGSRKDVAQKVLSSIRLSIFENYGASFYVLDDDAIKILFKQAEKIMASGNDDLSILTQIANGINADIIIYGEILEVKNNQLLLNFTSLERLKNNSLNIRSIVRIECLENQITHFSIEAGKKLINPSYKIKKTPSISIDYEIGINDINISIMKFKSGDGVIDKMLVYLKEQVALGDEYYNDKNFKQALSVYCDILDRIENKLLAEQKVKLKQFVAELKKRIDNSYIALIHNFEKKGDSQYFLYNFDDTVVYYNECLNLAENIYTRNIKIQLKKRFNEKVKTVVTTAQSYVANQVKLRIDESLYFNLLNKTNISKNYMLKALVLIEQSGFTPEESILLYNKAAKLIGISPVYRDKIKKNYDLN